MPIADVNGCKMYYEVSGIGPNVVFVHGEDHGIEMFEHQIAHLCRDYQCVAYYRRGHGRSELAPYGYSLRHQMLDLAGLLDRLHVAIAPLIIGDGKPAIRLAPQQKLRDCRRPQYRVFRMGGDMLFDCDLNCEAPESDDQQLTRII